MRHYWSKGNSLFVHGGCWKPKVVVNPFLPLFLLDLHVASVFGTLECDPLTSCLFAGHRNWAQELIIAVRPPKYAIGPDVACLPGRGACDNKFGSCADGSLHLEGCVVQILAYIGQVAYMLSNREGGNLVNKPGGQFVQNLSCREATEFYGLDHIFRNYFSLQLCHNFASWWKFAMLVNCAIKGGR